MSRHPVDANNRRYAITVGWDNALNTYFIQVEDTDLEENSEEDVLIIWEGTEYSAIQTPDELQEFLGNYGTIPESTLLALREDRVNGLDKGPTELQRKIIREISEAQAKREE